MFHMQDNFFDLRVLMPDMHVTRQMQACVVVNFWLDLSDCTIKPMTGQRQRFGARQSFTELDNRTNSISNI